MVLLIMSQRKTIRGARACEKHEFQRKTGRGEAEDPADHSVAPSQAQRRA
ncbi:hypothetical protein KKY_3469 [Pelagibacterium halotolerans B2]|uniref:Uncharacterized protein n=1 Tax=Pelagibacterium halotolerans (strain DSM 22347 / JCM 15775 / CGMCC 1.7692 / B2) TaxID=1082931 RepID=G4R9C1_PELHB|nr:hypothetical protein KKY_3469 [Pelagibacterium halotolerans B2]